MANTNIAPVFTAFRIFRNEAFENYVRLPKYAQHNVGQRFINEICECIVLLRKWESYYNTQFKLDAVNGILLKFLVISDLIEFMTDERMLSLKQCSRLILLKEDVGRQLGGIKKALEKSLQSRACQM